MNRDITDREWAMVLTGRRFVKATTGHGSMLVEYRNGVEELFTPMPKIKPDLDAALPVDKG